MEWTKEQEAAINHRGSAAIVSAAAGSGKTAVLVERAGLIISDSNNKVPADRLAITTFTKKAAEEIRLRLESKLAAITADKSDEWLEMQIVRLDDAPITTISAFCLNLLKGHEGNFGLSAGFRVLDELEAEEYCERALDFTISQLHINFDGDFTGEERDAIYNIYCIKSIEPIKKLLKEIHKGASRHPYPDEWLSNIEDFYLSGDKLKKCLLPFAEKELCRLANNCLEIAEELSSLLPTGKVAAAALKNETSLLKRIAEIELPDDKFIMEISGAKIPSWSSPRGVGDEVKSLRSNLKETFSQIYEIIILIESFDVALKLQKPAVQPLLRLYKIFRKEFLRLKTEANSVDFDDVERYCLTLLQKGKGNFKERFEEIIVDEFQDSNFIQYEIFRLLSKDETNLFFVGDIKQSIYRFRNAEPDVFLKVTENPRYKKFYLNRNFRSSNEVINSVNNLFAAIMTEDSGGVLYDATQKLIPGREISYGNEWDTELNILDRGFLKGTITTAEMEARYIAGRIREMIDGKEEIVDKNQRKRPLEYGDFAIISRSLSSSVKTYLRVFEEFNIPATRGGKSGDFITLREVDCILKLLDVIFDPYKDFELLAVLMSPLFGFTLGEVAQIRKNGKDKPLYRNLLSAEGELKEKADYFLKRLMRWRTMGENAHLTILIRDIAESREADCLVNAADYPKKAAANINLIYYYASQMSELTGGTPHGFLQFMKNNRDKGRQLGDAEFSSETEQSAVKLLTIHGSKGLEFPVCFIAACERGYNLRDTYPTVIVDKETGLAMRYIEPLSLIKYDTLPHRAAALKSKEEALKEEMRMLYVALTRAKDKLILVAAVKFKDGGVPVVVKNSYLNLLLDSAVFSPSYPVEDTINLEPKTFLSKENEKEGDFFIESRPYSRSPLTLIPKKLSATEINHSFVASVPGGAEYFYKDLSLKVDSNVGFSFGNSETMTGDSDEISIFPRLPSFIKEKKLTGKKRGDAYHKIMELIDFRKGNYEEQILSMKTRFTEEEWRAIAPLDIIAFFESELGKRAIKGEVQKEYPIYTEASFTELGLAPFDEIYTERPFVQGIADMFFYEDGHIILVDYKTDRRTNAERLIRNYSTQLSVYKRALREMTGLPVLEMWIYSFEIGAVLLEE